MKEELNQLLRAIREAERLTSEPRRNTATTSDAHKALVRITKDLLNAEDDIEELIKHL
jgi:hypothetical protein